MVAFGIIITNSVCSPDVRFKIVFPELVEGAGLPISVLLMYTVALVIKSLPVLRRVAWRVLVLPFISRLPEEIVKLPQAAPTVPHGVVRDAVVDVTT